MQRYGDTILRFLLNRLADLLIVTSLAAAVATGWFLYRGLYETIVSAQDIAFLRATVAVDDLHRPLLTEILRRMEAHAALPDITPASVRDVFSVPTATTAPKP